MEKVIDLHCHSNHSDGSMTPTELVRHAKKNNISAIALSDHDTVSGVALALAEGARVGVEVIPAIEISVSAKTETHIVGLFIDFSEKNLTEKIRKSLNARRVRNGETCAKLNELGFDITLDEVYAVAGSEIVGRAHFSRVMAEKGYVKNPKEAFTLYLGNGCPAYSNVQFFSAKEAIELIHGAGGIAIAAHLHQMKLSDKVLYEYLKELKAYGLDGVEGYYTEYTSEMGEKFRKMASDLSLVLSGGSDFHAAMKPQIEIGSGYGDLKISYSLLESLRAYRDALFGIQ